MKNQELFITMPSGRVFRAVVRGHHVALQDGADNNELFADLGIGNKFAFCQAAYGYAPTKGNWPWFREGDYAALQRLFAALCDRGVVITKTGVTQKKHLSKPATYANACAQKACAPCKQTAAPAVDPLSQGVRPTFRSPLLDMPTHKW